MKAKKQYVSLLILLFTLFLTIIDAKHVLIGVKEGITLCLYTIIPSLFPFLIITNMINKLLIGRHIPILAHIARTMGMPAGAESILLLGLLGGYPVGAQAVSDIYHSRIIDQNTARRLLGFCSNAGPAFIFGIIGPSFSNGHIAWVIWAIHILSAVLVGVILPGKSNHQCHINVRHKASVAQSMEKTVRVLAIICCWVIIFRIILNICSRWFLWLIPQNLAIIFSGILELSNGCVELCRVVCEGERFIISIGMLTLGGCCIGMQTLSVTRELGTGLYVPGKILQTAISVLVAYYYQYVFFPAEHRCAIHLPWILLTLSIICMIIFILRKKTSSILAINHV